MGIGTYGQLPGINPGQTSGGVLRLYGRQPVTLDPALAGDANSTEYIDKIFSGLVTLNDKLEIRSGAGPKLGRERRPARFTPSTCATGLKFQDGTPVTADDFKYSVERITDTGHRLAGRQLVR